MKKLIQLFFTILGIIFFLLLLVGTYLYMADPFEIKPLIQSFTTQSATPTTTTKPTDSAATDKNSLLSPVQEQALEKIGINPAALPSIITPAIATCFYAKLGETRATEIKNGSKPTAADFFAARACL